MERGLQIYHGVRGAIAAGSAVAGAVAPIPRRCGRGHLILKGIPPTSKGDPVHGSAHCNEIRCPASFEQSASLATRTADALSYSAATASEFGS